MRTRKLSLVTCRLCGDAFFAHNAIHYCSELCSFTAKTIFSADLDACWLWNHILEKNGYGRFTYRDTTQSAHRFSYRSFNGPIGDDLIVRHTCHNPRCVNPRHLLTGTHCDNKRDMVEAGRAPVLRGKSFKRNLTPAQVLEIYNSSEKNRVLAERYNINGTRVTAIKNGYHYVNLTGHNRNVRKHRGLPLQTVNTAPHISE